MAAKLLKFSTIDCFKSFKMNTTSSEICMPTRCSAQKECEIIKPLTFGTLIAFVLTPTQTGLFHSIRGLKAALSKLQLEQQSR